MRTSLFTSIYKREEEEQFPKDVADMGMKCLQLHYLSLSM